jgi:protein phosphatase 1G
MQGWRNSMEDAHLTNLSIDDRTSCFGVFDGHGGKEVALFASKHFATELALNSKFQGGRAGPALKEAFMRMDTLMRSKMAFEELFCLARGLRSVSEVDAEVFGSYQCKAGCTAVVALILGNELFVANAGDSRCVLARGGSAIDMSTDHKTTLPGEAERIRRAGGTIYEGRVNGTLNLTRALGDFEFKNHPRLSPQEQMITADPEVQSCFLTCEDDFLVLACDGIWDVLTSQELVDFIYMRLTRQSLDSICEQLCDRCLARDITEANGRGSDNMTVVLVTWDIPF